MLFCACVVPNDPGNVREMERGQSYLKIEFEAPWNTYDGFEVTWVEKGSGEDPKSAQLQKDDRSYQILDLTSSTTYDIRIYSTSGDQKSAGSSLELSTSLFY